jgi:nucleoside-diphosphate-sugar epimerase
LGIFDSIIGEITNLGADKEYTLNQISDILKNVCAEFGYGFSKEHREARHEVKNAFCNHDKAKTLLKFNDSTDVRNLIREMFLWAKDQPNRTQKEMRYEIEKNMYSFWKRKGQ